MVRTPEFFNGVPVAGLHPGDLSLGKSSRSANPAFDYEVMRLARKAPIADGGRQRNAVVLVLNEIPFCGVQRNIGFSAAHTAITRKAGMVDVTACIMILILGAAMYQLRDR